MGEYEVKGGGTLTDAEIEHLGEACERGEYPGEPGKWVARPQGRPTLSSERFQQSGLRPESSRKDSERKEEPVS